MLFIVDFDIVISEIHLISVKIEEVRKMASRTNCIINGQPYYRLRRKVGRRKNSNGQWTTDYKLFYGKSRKEAEQKYIDYITKSTLSKETCFGEAFEEYITDVFNIDGSIKDSTKAIYINSFYRVFDNTNIGGYNLDEINGQDLQRVINASKSNAGTIKQAVKILKRFYRWLSSQRITSDITQSLVLPRVNHKRQDENIEVFSSDDLKRFKNDTPLDNRLRFMIILAIETGMRIGEILGLQYSDFNGGSVRVNRTLQEIEPEVKGNAPTTFKISTPKTLESIRTIPINDTVLQELERHKKWHTKEMRANKYQTPYIFTTANGTFYYKKNLRRALQRLCNDLDIQFRSFHVFRHTFGSRLANAGVPIQTVASLMGHSNITVTSKYYINVEEDNKRKAINIITL